MLCIGAGAKGFNRGVFFQSLNEGYKAFDIGSIYHGTDIVGDCIARIQNERGVDLRSCGRLWPGYKDLRFISKLWINELGNNRKSDCESRGNDIETSCRKTISRLNLTYIDVLLIHWPLKVNAQTNITEEFIIEEIWPQLEELVRKGLVKEIGVSNFGLVELHKVLDVCRIRPAYNEIEVNPYNNNKLVVGFCNRNGIKVLGHSPFSFGWSDGHIKLLREPVLQTLASKYQVPVTCVILNWMIGKNVTPVVGTSSIEHLREFKHHSRFSLLESEKRQIDLMENGQRLYAANYAMHNCSHYPKYSFNNWEALVGTATSSSPTSTFLAHADFLTKCKASLTAGPGYLIVKGLAKGLLRVVRDNVPPPPEVLNRWSRWNGHGGVKTNLINSHPAYSELIDNNLVGLIVESLLGWDCKLDNCAFSISRGGDLSSFFGPHQDSPFEQNPGARLPPHDYPLVIQCIYAVDDFTEDNGSLFVVPYSHKNRLRINLPEQGNAPKGAVPANAQTVRMSAGDVCIALGNIWHGATINTTQTDRRAFLVEYVSSVVEPRDRLNEKVILESIWRSFSARMIRLLYGGRERFFAQPTLLHAWERYLKDNGLVNRINI